MAIFGDSTEGEDGKHVCPASAAYDIGTHLLGLSGTIKTDPNNNH
jgi:hypothetical protein